MQSYEKVKLLGKGSYGKVYLVAKKTLVSGKKESELMCLKYVKCKAIEERVAIENEVASLRALRHPYIVNFREAFNHKLGICIVMDYYDFGDLASLMRQRKEAGKRFEESQALNQFSQILLGLNFMHQNHHMHRDIKPENIFLMRNGQAVLGDLGVSKSLAHTKDFATTCIGTPSYMAPEIFNNRPYSFQSDIFALGCTLYEMIALRVPFRASSMPALAFQITHGRYDKLKPGSCCSPSLCKLVASMLHNKPDKRPTTNQILQLPIIQLHLKGNLRLLEAGSYHSEEGRSNLTLQLRKVLTEAPSDSRLDPEEKKKRVDPISSNGNLETNPKRGQEVSMSQKREGENIRSPGNHSKNLGNHIRRKEGMNAQSRINRTQLVLNIVPSVPQPKTDIIMTASSVHTEENKPNSIVSTNLADRIKGVRIDLQNALNESTGQNLDDLRSEYIKCARKDERDIVLRLLGDSAFKKVGSLLEQLFFMEESSFV